MDSLTPESIALYLEILACLALVGGCVYVATCPRESVQVCALVVVLWFLLSEGAESAIAQTTQPTGAVVTAPQTFPTVLKDGVQLPDWSKISFSSMNPFSESGSVTIPPEFAGALGFGSVDWKAGQKIADALPMGAISDCLGAGKLTQNKIDGITGLNSSGTALSNFLPAGLQNIQSLASAVPDLKNKLVGDVAPIRDLVAKGLAGQIPGVDLSSLQGLAGQVQQAQQVVSTTGGAVGSLSNGKFLDTAGNVLGALNSQGQVIDPSGTVLGALNASGQFVNPAGQVVGALSGGAGSVAQALQQAATQSVSQASTQAVSQAGGYVGIWWRTANKRLPTDEFGQLSNQYPQLAQLGLKNLDLSQYTMSQIPELGNAQLGNFQNWEQVLMKGVPGFDKIPFSQFPSPLGESDTPYVARVDVPLDKAEQDREKSLSGSYKQGFRVPCTQNCTHAELSPIEGSQMDVASAGAFANGKVWMNRDQMVQGGEGVLSVVNGGKEPTGRNPYCSAFKQVITVVDQAKGKISTGMYFRVCKHGIPDLGCTPYFIGPIPFLTYAEKQFIYLGQANPKDDGGGINVNQDPLSSGDGFVPDCSATLSGDAVQKAIAASRNPGAAGKYIPLVLGAAKAQGITDPAQVAYMLATAEHETDAFNTMHEYASGAEYEGRDDLGNMQSGDGVRYKGRGFAQLTGRENYRKLGGILKVDLINNPDLAAQPDIAAKIFAYGMKNGAYTSQKLGDYINGNRVDFYNARRIVNGTDRAGLIAGYAQKYYDAIKSTLADATASTSGNCGGGGAPITAGSINDRIHKSAQDLKGKINQCNNADTSYGKEGCQNAVNQVLKHAGLSPMNGLSITDTEACVSQGRCQKVDPSQAQPGDILVVDDGASRGHVGVCMSAGCQTSLSNSSSWCSRNGGQTGTAGGFVYEDDGRFSQSYGSSIPRYIYRFKS